MKTNGVFSDFSKTVPSYASSTNPVTQQQEQKGKNKVLDTVKTVAPIVIPLAAIPVTALVTHKLSKANLSELTSKVATLTDDVAKLTALTEQRTILNTNTVQEGIQTAKKSSEDIWKALILAAGLGTAYKAGDLSDDDKKTVTIKLADKISDSSETSHAALREAQQSMAISGNSLLTKYMNNVNGIQLLKCNESKNETKYKAAIEQIKKAAPKRLYEAPNVKPISTKDTVWSVTSEFRPIMDGGLGSVPPAVQTNANKLKVDMPTFIPMYQQKGVANFVEKDGKYQYKYADNVFDLEKLATFKLDTYQGTKAKVEDVEIYSTTLPYGQKLIFIKNDTYFNGPIYNTNEKTEEPEKFAFFSKAVYEFAKAKMDERSVKGLKVANTSAFDEIKAPKAMILNDWQASPIAALTRYKAPLENAYGQLTDTAARNLSEMNLITIGHNAMYQGSTRDNNNDSQRKEVTSNILNTLFDNFAYDIVDNATTEAFARNTNDAGLKNLDNVLILNKDDAHANHTNFLNMGICLSDYFHPVSKNYAKEIVNDGKLSGELRWALTQRDVAGSLYGIINGNDFHTLSIEGKHEDIKKSTTLDFAKYSKVSSIDDVMKARKQNKEKFYTDFILPFSMKDEGSTDPEMQKKIDRIKTIKGNTAKLEFVKNPGMTLPSAEEIKNSPVLASVGRLANQKGIDILADAIKLLMDRWDTDFPGKNKPIFYLAGGECEATGTRQPNREFIEKLKNEKLSKEDSDRVIFMHGRAPMQAIAGSADFFLLPSRFEPCGLTQTEAFALATPVIGSAVGGIVDTVNRNGKENGVLTEKGKELTPQALYEAMKDGLKIYFEQPEKYTNMVNDALQEDFSWIQKGKQGPVYDYLEKLGMNRDDLPDVQ